MSANASDLRVATRHAGILNIALWVVQILLAALYGLAGVMKLSLPIPQLAHMMHWPGDVPEALVRFIGFSEVAGALGLLLPAALRILPWLTPLAALGLVTIQVLAIPFHAMRGELPMVLPVNLTLLALAAFVAWGRFAKAPIAARR